MEKPLAQSAGLGWQGKHTNLVSRQLGSWFFLGAIFTTLELPVDAAGEDLCGSCRACLDICPTAAFPAPYRLDARRCISYLTIEHDGAIPVELRGAIGNRIYGCDDCQLFCPWNKFAARTKEPDFAPRHALDDAELVDLFAWDEATFLDKTEGSAIRRIGFERWLRNIAVALGNAVSTPEVITALESRRHDESPLVSEHVDWALAQHDREA
jgi:epoxyqueuosine reductase